MTEEAVNKHKQEQEYAKFCKQAITKTSVKYINALNKLNPKFKHHVTRYYTECTSFDFKKCTAKEALPSINVIQATNKCVEEINFAGATWLTDELLVPILRNNVMIRKLNLSSCDALTGQSLREASNHCLNLTHVNLSNCLWLDKKSFDRFLRRSKFVRDLDVSGCAGMEPSAIMRVITSRCSFHLETIRLPSTFSSSPSSLSSLLADNDFGWSITVT